MLFTVTYFHLLEKLAFLVGFSRIKWILCKFSTCNCNNKIYNIINVYTKGCGALCLSSQAKDKGNEMDKGGGKGKGAGKFKTYILRMQKRNIVIEFCIPLNLVFCGHPIWYCTNSAKTKKVETNEKKCKKVKKI